MARELREVRPPEWVLDELYKTARRWMSARARTRRHGPSFGEASAGDHPPAYEDAASVERATGEAANLRQRFDELVEEFIERVERE